MNTFYMPKTLKAKSACLLFGSLFIAVLFIGGSVYLTKAAAAAPKSGDVIKGGSSSIYYVTADGKRLSFPNVEIYLSWYPDFSNVKIFSNSQVAALPLAGFVTLRPGESPVKFKSANKVYAVAQGGVLRHLQTEVQAAMIFGADWNKKIITLPDDLLASYAIGDMITGPGQYWWKQEMAKAPSIAADEAAGSPTSNANANTNTNENTNTPVAGQITIISGVSSASFIRNVTAESADADGNKAEDVRTFTVTFAAPAKNIQLVVDEKTTGKVFYSNILENGAAIATNSIKATVGEIENGLKPNTVYTWKFVAEAATASATDTPTTATGEFTTADFDPASLLQFKITKVSVDKLDAQSFPAEDVCSFGLTFNHPAKNIVLTVTEKNIGVVFHTESVKNGATVDSTTEVTPVDWTAKLKPSTTYTWMVTADAATAVNGATSITATGDFTTSVFDPAKPLIFKIGSVLLGAPTVGGAIAQNLRDFNISFVNPAKNVVLTVTEKVSGAVFHSVSVQDGAIIRDVASVHMADWNVSLQPGTAYTWTVTADAASPNAVGQSDTATGDFVTAAKF
jgi:hypothetical protein